MKTREPALTIGTATAVVAAVIALLVAFGLDLSTEQQTAILTAVGVIAPIVGALLTRPRVTPVGERRAD